MACIYIYKGRSFNSELEFDDYLLEKAKFEPEFGDLVFSMSPALLTVSSKLSEIAKQSNELKKVMSEAIRSGKVIYDEDGNMAVEDPPYIGVNKFLSGLKNSKGELLFPEFREEEYWNRRFINWKNGNFTDNEIEEFGLDKDHLPKITDPEQCNKLKQQMKHKWEILAKTGTAIHSVLQVCFSKLHGNYNFELDDASLTDLINNSLKESDKKFLTPTAIKQTIEYAKKLNQDLTHKFGEGCSYYTEFAVTLDTNTTDKPTKLMGIIDLLIVDKNGIPHILDYKTSIHDYLDFGTPKKLAYIYLLSTYQRMLDKYGLNTYGGSLLVAPIQIKGFKKEGDTYTYDGIENNTSFIPLDTHFENDVVWNNIDEFMPAPFKLSITTEKAVSTVATIMSKWFPLYQSSITITRENVIKRLKKWGKLTPNDKGEYVYRKYGKEAPITAKTETEFIDKVLLYEQSLPSNRIRYTGLIKSVLKEAIDKGIENVDFPTPVVTEAGGQITWLKDILSPYCNDTWEVYDNELLELYGIITVKTRTAPNLIDFIRVSTNDLTADYRINSKNKDNKILQERRGLTGIYEVDVVQKSRSGSLMAEAVQGNVELMETLLLINQMGNLGNCTVGNIQVVNPRYGNGIGLSNEELLYCWKELNKHDSVEQDNLLNGKIKFASKYELARMKFADIMKQGEAHSWSSGYQKFSRLKSDISLLDENINSKSEDKLNALKKLLKDLENTNDKLKKVYSTEAEIQSKEVALHNSILYAIAQLKGVNLRQQIKDHDLFIDNLAIWKHGLSGTYMDNPGNMDSLTLNLVTSLVTEAYQNVRDEIQVKKVKIQKLVKALKELHSFGALELNTIGNQVDLYKNMFREENGDFLFKNPNELVGAEKEFLQFVLTEINRARFPQALDEELQEMLDSDNIEYYRVPLAQGSQDSLASTNGLLATLRAKLSLLNPKKAFENARKKIEGVFNSEETIELQLKSELLYSMTNLFDRGNDTEKRLKYISDNGIGSLEHNLETLLYKHLFAYSLKNNIDGVFPMIKAAMVHICTLGAILNHTFKNDTHYLENYIRNKIFNLSIIDPKLLDAAKYAGLVKLAASAFTLAFSPVQALYQPLQGLWTDISLMIRKPDGKDSFTFSNFKTALKLVYSDLSHYSEEPTLCSALNETYAINDMDMNTYTDRISTAKRGIWNFDNFAYKFASRPDYYNRMTIFTALMLADGSLKAHHIVDGELVYNWKEDKRFEAFANNRVSDPEYNKLKALYYAIAKQFVNEHAKNKDGSEFKLNMDSPMALPRAYTNKLAESMKSLGDDIYGYYAHEKKSLIMSTALGSLWLQFKTYWSGKKNQYLQSGGVRLRGNWEQYTEGDKKYYYQVDADGNVLYDEPPTTDDTGVPFILWKGQWQEGIILTLADIAKNSWNSGLVDNKGIHINALKEGWNSKWNNDDPNLQLAYRNNIKQGAYDLMMLVLGGCILSALLGDWLDDLKKQNKKDKNFVEGLYTAAANVGVMSVRNSFLDFNTWDSIGGALSSWTPFSFEWTSRTFKNLYNTALGDTSFWDGVVNTFSTTKQLRPLFDSIKPEMFENK